jgi:hypothetical protein
MVGWLRDRESEIARKKSELEDAGRRFVADATHATQEAFAETPLARALRTEPTAKARAKSTSAQRDARPPASWDQQILENARRLEAMAKARIRPAVERVVESGPVRHVAGEAARKGGNLTGLVTGTLKSAEDMKDGAVFFSRLVDVTEPWRVPRGEAAWDELFGGLGALVDYGAKAFKDPGAIQDDFIRVARQKRQELDPNATPAARTLAGEVRRNFDIGRNQGETVAEGAAWALGAAELKAAARIGALSKAELVSKFRGQGFSEAKAAHLAELYDGKGHHSGIPERARLPEVLGGGPYPRWILDSPFNRLHPAGISRGEMYELHSRVDPYFKGTGFPRRMGPGGWSAKKLGIEKYAPLERVYYGTPGPTKALVGGTAIAGGGYLNEAMEDAGWR